MFIPTFSPTLTHPIPIITGLIAKLAHPSKLHQPNNRPSITADTTKKKTRKRRDRRTKSPGGDILRIIPLISRASERATLTYIRARPPLEGKYGRSSWCAYTSRPTPFRFAVMVGVVRLIRAVRSVRAALCAFEGRVAAPMCGCVGVGVAEVDMLRWAWGGCGWSIRGRIAGDLAEIWVGFGGVGWGLERVRVAGCFIVVYGWLFRIGDSGEESICWCLAACWIYLYNRYCSLFSKKSILMYLIAVLYVSKNAILSNNNVHILGYMDW